MAEDSYSLLPILDKELGQKYQRVSTIHHSIDGTFAVRKGNWKLILGAGSGGWSAPKHKQALVEGSPPFQLYNLSDDMGETINLYKKYPDIVEELVTILKELNPNY